MQHSVEEAEKETRARASRCRGGKAGELRRRGAGEAEQRRCASSVAPSRSIAVYRSSVVAVQRRGNGVRRGAEEKQRRPSWNPSCGVVERGDY